MKLNKLQNYILVSIGEVFVPIFSSIFFIASIFIFLQISSKTTFLRITFLDMLKFYYYSLPQILVYILPVSFFASSVIALGKLSFDSELIVAYSIGANTSKIMKPIVFGSIIVALASLLFSFVALPQSRHKSKEFLYSKESTAELNLKPSEFGQKFGNYFLFVKEKSDENTYKDIVVLNPSEKNSIFVKADNAHLKNEENIISLVLKNGQAYLFGDSDIRKIFFKDMLVNRQLSGKKLDFLGIMEYWEYFYRSDYQWEIFLQILVAFFPLMSYFLIASLGIYNPRYDKNRAVFLIIISLVIFFYLTDLLGKKIQDLTLVILPSIWISTSYIYYRKKLKVY